MLTLPHWPKIPIWRHNKKLDLQSVKLTLKALGDPHKNLPPTIHVAGTNGKGSTIAMLRGIFETANYKVHSYTSPHLVEFNERINLSGINISDHYLFDLLEEVRITSCKLLGDDILSFFEGITIAAFLAFARTPADILLLETGMGGRLDCTNVIERPFATIITPISYDHMTYLGNSLTEIAFEKAGIIKPETPCVISAQTNQVYKLLFDRCDEVGSKAFAYEYDYIIEDTNNGLVYRSKNHSINLPYPNLIGKHQYLNAGAAIATALIANGIGSDYKLPTRIQHRESDATLFQISNAHIGVGITKANWPGRIEQIKHSKYPNLNIYLDGAHNESGAYVLASWIGENLEKPTYIIIGITKNRSIADFCRPFKGILSGGYAVKVISEPSSYHPDVIKEQGNDYIAFTSSNSLEESLTNINNIGKCNVIITGSLFLISDFYKYLFFK